MATLNRTVYYAHRPDFFTEIEEARSHTPPEFIIARQNAQSQRDHSSLFSRRIARLTHPHHVRLPDHDENEVVQEAYPQPLDSNMSRATPTSNRPTHIPLPTTPFVATNGSPSQTPASPTSPRSSFLPSFMRSRSRAATLSGRPGGSPTSEVPPASGLSSTRPGNSSVTRSVSTPTNDAGLAATAAGPATAVEPPPESSTPVQTYRIRLVPHLESSRSLAFDPVVRELMPIRVPAGTSVSAAAASVTSVGRTVNGRPPALLLKIGRFTDKSAVPPTSAQANGSGTGATGSGFGGNTLTIAGGGGDVCSGKVAFKSKVVSRSHAEIWCEAGGKFYIRDSASSSGTFLNHIRLSSPNQGSRPTQITDGDILQLGVDYQGGQEDMYRCVKMRVELGRDWQRAASEFNNNALKQLKALGGDVKPADGSAKKGRASVTDCCICLFSVTVCQSLFIAPCSHVFHYKCIRPLLVTHHPGFSCPLCRTFANLDEDVETEDAWEVASRRASVISRRPSSHSIRLPPTTDAPPPLPGSEVAPGQPSTGVGFGGGAASVAQLLSQTSSGVSDSENSDVPMLGATVDAAAPLARQTTITDGQDHSEGHTAALHGDPALSASLAVVNDPSSLDRMEGVQIPTGFFDHSTSASASEAQTPMNDTFLATLAPSMHQRLELARQIDQVGERVAPVDEEAEAETEAEHEGRGEPAARDTREATEGMDLDETEVDRRVDAMYT